MATPVIDKASQQVVEVDNAEAQRGIQQGRYGVIADRPVQVRRGADEIGEVDPADLAAALAQGWELSDSQEHQQIEIQREESDIASSILGFGEAAAAGASLGLSTLALEDLGVDPERMRARREGLGAGATLAEVGGGLAAILGTGGASLGARAGAAAAERGVAARGLSVLGAPTRAVEALGQTVERGVARIAGPGMARVAAPTARGVVEGYFAGAGAQIDENVLGNREQSAESIFIDGGMSGALFGAALGLGLPIAFDAARGAVRVPVDAARRALGRATGAPGGEVGELVARDVADSKGSIWDRESMAESIGGIAERVAPISGARPDVAGRAFRAAVKEPQRITDLLSRRSQIEESAAATVRDHVPRVQEALDVARINSQGDAKLARIARTLGEFEAEAGPAYVRAAQERIGRRLKYAEDINARTGFTSYDANALRKIRALTERLETEVSSVSPKVVRGEGGKFVRKRKATTTDAALSFGSYDRFKRDLAKIIDDTGGFSGRPKFGATSATVEINGLARSMYKDAKELLENAAVWGKGASTIQKDLNASWSRAANAIREFKGEAKGTGLGSVFAADGSINMAQALRLVRQYNRAGGTDVVNAFDDALQAQLDHLDVVRKHYDLPPEAAKSIKDAESAVAELRRTMAQQSKDAGDLADLMELRGAESGSSVSIGIGSNLGTIAGGVLGSAVGGPVGAVAGMMAGSIARPYTAARTLASLLAMADRVGSMRGAATGGMLSRIAGPAASKLAKIGAAASDKTKSTITPITYASTKDRNDRIDRVRQEAAVLATSPDQLQQRIERSLSVVQEVAPGTANEIAKVAQRATMFLASKAPTTYSSPFSGRPPIVDPASADRYLRYVEAVEHPLETLALLDSGMLTAEHAEAIRIVYPQLWQSTQDDIAQALGAAAAEGREVPYRDRLQLAVLLDMPTTLSPQQLVAVQMGNAATAAAEQMPTGKIKSGPVKGSSEATMTATERVESGIARA